jgi:hypothetical protein
MMNKLTDRELATVLAALRLFQRQRGGFNRPEWGEHFVEVRPLTDRQIDALCERLNCGGSDGK